MSKITKANTVKLLASLFVLVMFPSCNNNSSFDLSESWIEYYKYDDDLDEKGELINQDSIVVSVNDNFIIRIKTQSNDCSFPLILKQTNGSEFVDITNIPGEASLESNYKEGNGYRQINKIYIEPNESVFSKGQSILYKTIIGSINGDIENEIKIKIK